MTQFSLGWTTNGVGDGRAGGYTMADVIAWFVRTYVTDQEDSEGVLFGFDGGLEASGVASPISVATGGAVVYGYLFGSDSVETLAVTSPAVGTTGLRVVLQADKTAQTVRLVCNRNTDGVSSVPALEQDWGVAGIWEISIATGTITTAGVIALTNDRSYCHFATKVRTEMIDDDAITNAKIATGAVNSDSIQDGAIVNADVNAAAAIDGSKLAANSVTATQIAAGAIGNSELAVDSVDHENIRYAIPTLTQRQGGSATEWQSYGTTNRVLTSKNVSMFCGIVQWNGSATFGLVTVTFPTAFAYSPLVFCQIAYYLGGSCTSVSVTSVNPSGISEDEAVLYWQSDGTLTHVEISWLAIGELEVN